MYDNSGDQARNICTYDKEYGGASMPDTSPVVHLSSRTRQKAGRSIELQICRPKISSTKGANERLKHRLLEYRDGDI